MKIYSLYIKKLPPNLKVVLCFLFSPPDLNLAKYWNDVKIDKAILFSTVLITLDRFCRYELIVIRLEVIISIVLFLIGSSRSCGFSRRV